MAKTPGTTHSRGYGRAHQDLRAQWAIRVATGTILCARCGQSIDADQPWDLGHNEARDGYTGPEHASCNRRAAANKRNGKHVPRLHHPTSRQW